MDKFSNVKETKFISLSHSILNNDKFNEMRLSYASTTRQYSQFFVPALAVLIRQALFKKL